MDIDHLVYATPHLDATVARLERRLGVRATPGGQHAGEGTRNALVALGPACYLEVLGPDDTQPAPPRARWFSVDGLDAPRLVAWAVRAANLPERVAEARRGGVALGDLRAGSRLRTDGSRLAWHYSDPHVVLADGVVPFLIDWGDSPHPAQSAAPGLQLRALQAEHPEPQHVQQLLQQLGVSMVVTAAAHPALIATLETPLGVVELR